MAKETLTFRVEPHVIDRLDEIAAVTGESRSEVAERALGAGLEDMGESMETMGNPIVRETLGRMLMHPKFMKSMHDLFGDKITQIESEKKSARMGRIVEAGRKKGSKQ